MVREERNMQIFAAHNREGPPIEPSKLYTGLVLGNYVTPPFTEKNLTATSVAL